MPLKKNPAVAAQESAYDATVGDVADVTLSPSSSNGQAQVDQPGATATATRVEDTAQAAEPVEQRQAAEQVQQRQQMHEEPEQTPAYRPESEASQERGVAAAAESTAVATQASSGMHGRMGELEQEGFEGLEMGFGAFPTLVLTGEGRFQTGDRQDCGTEVVCTIETSKAKFIVKNTRADKRDEDFCYTYDANWATNKDALDTNGNSVWARIDGWASKGWGYEGKKYIDLGVSITKDVVGASGAVVLEAGTFVLAQIPKTSIGRFTGYAARMGAQRLRSVPTALKVGAKITNVDYPFYPWDFAQAR